MLSVEPGDQDNGRSAQVSARLAERPFVEPANRQEWREWLEENHATSTGAWVGVGKKGGRVTSLSYDDAVEEALCFGWIDSTVNRIDDDRFRQLFTPRKPNSSWAISNKTRVARLIAEGRMTPAGMALVEAAKRDGSWDLLESVENLVMPEDVRAALAAAPGAAAGFEELPTAERKRTLYWIQSAKRPETRARRIAETVGVALLSKTPVAQGRD